LHNVTAEGRACGGGEFEVDGGADGERAEGGADEGSSRGIAVRQTPLTAMLSPVRQRPASAGAARMMRVAPSVGVRETRVPVVSMRPVNIGIG